MEQWLIALLEEAATSYPDWATMHWSTKRRIIIERRWSVGAQNEAISDNLNGRTAAYGGKWELYQSEIAAIKAAIPKV